MSSNSIKLYKYIVGKFNEINPFGIKYEDMYERGGDSWFKNPKNKHTNEYGNVYVRDEHMIDIEKISKPAIFIIIINTVLKHHNDSITSSCTNIASIIMSQLDDSDSLYEETIEYFDSIDFDYEMISPIVLHPEYQDGIDIDKLNDSMGGLPESGSPRLQYDIGDFKPEDILELNERLSYDGRGRYLPYDDSDYFNQSKNFDWLKKIEKVNLRTVLDLEKWYQDKYLDTKFDARYSPLFKILGYNMPIYSSTGYDIKVIMNDDYFYIREIDHDIESRRKLEFNNLTLTNEGMFDVPLSSYKLDDKDSPYYEITLNPFTVFTEIGLLDSNIVKYYLKLWGYDVPKLNIKRGMSKDDVQKLPLENYFYYEEADQLLHKTTGFKINEASRYFNGSICDLIDPKDRIENENFIKAMYASSYRFKYNNEQYYEYDAACEQHTFYEEYDKLIECMLVINSMFGKSMVLSGNNFPETLKRIKQDRYWSYNSTNITPWFVEDNKKNK